MKEEEAVFGPLLKENFERKELEDMNETVLKQHTLFREKVRSEKSLVKAVKRKRSGDVFDELDFTLDDLRFRKSYCQEVNDHLVIVIILSTDAYLVSVKWLGIKEVFLKLSTS